MAVKMSIEIMNAVWRESKSSGRQKLVLLAIADHQGEIGAWPSIDTLATMVNASPRSVQRDIQELVALGELEVQIQAAPSRGQYKSNLYWVKLPGVTKTLSGVTDLTSGVTELVSGVTPVGVLNLIEPLQKPNRNLDSYKQDFEIFWKQYPRKEGKPKANREYLKMANELGTDYLMQQLLIWLSHPSKKDRTYWPHAERWLRDRRFDDELPSASGIDKSKILGWFE